MNGNVGVGVVVNVVLIKPWRIVCRMEWWWEIILQGK